jgi:5-formyltetrahydrofolate cyclo-ligase
MDHESWARARKLELRSSFARPVAKDEATAPQLEALYRNLEKLLPPGQGSVAGFLSLKTEPDLRPFFLRANQDWCFPRVQGPGPLAFYRSQTFAVGSLGVQEPVPDPAGRVSAEDVSVFLVPGLVFDWQGGRLGRGRGYYDQTLSKSSGVRIGVCWSHRVLMNDKVPMVKDAPHDVPMDWLVTEKFIVKCGFGIAERNVS